MPYHLLELKDFEKLKSVLLDYQMFEQLYKEDTKVQLMMFWRELGGYKTAADSYVRAFTHDWYKDWFAGEITQVSCPFVLRKNLENQLFGFNCFCFLIRTN